MKELEEKGIGRPSTYAAIISTIVEREYVNKDQGRFTPTLLGERVSGLLMKSFEDVFDVDFTARMEEELDEIEEGKLPWRDFRSRNSGIASPWISIRPTPKCLSYKAGIPTGKKCEKCGEGELLERISRHGFFLGCSRYPDCDFIEDYGRSAAAIRAMPRPPRNIATIAARKWLIKRGRFGTFLACTGYPDCKTTRRMVQGTQQAHAAGRSARRKVPHLRRGPIGAPPRTLRRIHRLPELSQVQVHARRSRWASSARSATKANSFAAASAKATRTRAHILRLQPLSGLRFHHAVTSPSPSRARSARRRSSWKSAPRRQFPRVHQGRLRLGKVARAGQGSRRWSPRREPVPVAAK